VVTNRDRCNGDVMVPEMSDHHGMLEEPPHSLNGDGGERERFYRFARQSAEPISGTRIARVARGDRRIALR
jgi:hypothetical protein